VIFLQHARAGTRCEVADRVVQVTRDGIALRAERQHLGEQRIARVAAPHARDEPARHTQRKQPCRRPRRLEQPGVELQRREQLRGVADGLLQRALPERGLTGRGDAGIMRGFVAAAGDSSRSRRVPHTRASTTR
jgi:hypothetical protein